MNVKLDGSRLVVEVEVSDEVGVRKLVGALGVNVVLTALLGLKPTAPTTSKPGPKPAAPAPKT